MAEKHEKPCPKCGHCPTCGRSNFGRYYYPMVYPWGYRPYPYYTQPIWTNVGAQSQMSSGGMIFNNAAAAN